ncbi:MerR family transcriptional regulator [Actinacidiphila alni]|uniref:MerR family transcriptional regulator n=1 Tax=Actinacidiphila alni TaxID=380248 RepID=UPI0033F9F1DE
MRIGEAARPSGTTARSPRHYEDEGLIVPGRRSNGYRGYCRSTLDRVLLVRALLESGLPVRLIRQALPGPGVPASRRPDAPGGRRPACTDAEFLREVRAHRDRLAALDAYVRDSGIRDSGAGT